MWGLTPIFPARLDLAKRSLILDDPTGEIITLVLNRDAVLWLQDMPGRVQVEIGRAVKVKSRPLECYYWGHVVPKAARNESHTLTHPEAHRLLLDTCAPRDRFGRPITTSDEDFTRLIQLEYVEACRDFLAREMGVHTMDPDKNWRANGHKEKT